MQNPTARKPATAQLVRPENLAFARKLRGAMAEKNMSASDLARAIWGTSPDPRGYSVAKNRDKISGYLTGTRFPSKETLSRLVAALDLSADDIAVPQKDNDVHAFSGQGDVVFIMLKDHPGMCLLRVAKPVPIEIGLKIINLILSVTTE